MIILEGFIGKASTFSPVQRQGCQSNNDLITVAENDSDSAHGKTLVYAIVEHGAIGFVDIRNPSIPTHLGIVDYRGDPTSVAIVGGCALVSINGCNRLAESSGQLKIIDRNSRTIVSFPIDVGGHQDSIFVSHDCTYAVLAIDILLAGSGIFTPDNDGDELRLELYSNNPLSAELDGFYSFGYEDDDLRSLDQSDVGLILLSNSYFGSSDLVGADLT